ncbi:hypothetical protein WI664_17625 [Vibrio cholerae]
MGGEFARRKWNITLTQHNAYITKVSADGTQRHIATTGNTPILPLPTIRRLLNYASDAAINSA